MVVVVGERRLDVDAGEELGVARRDLAPPGEDPVELLELADPERGREVVEAVVVAEPAVLEPARRLEAALVAERHEQLVLGLGIGRHGPPSPVVICLFG